MFTKKMIDAIELGKILSAKKQELLALQEVMIHHTDRSLVEARLSILNDITQCVESSSKNVRLQPPTPMNNQYPFPVAPPAPPSIKPGPAHDGYDSLDGIL